jgi:hypothetical protein
MDLYYMSSSNVVFVCDAGRMFHTQNKLLVPEWPCIIEVSYIYSSYSVVVLLPLVSGAERCQCYCQFYFSVTGNCVGLF